MLVARQWEWRGDCSPAQGPGVQGLVRVPQPSGSQPVKPARRGLTRKVSAFRSRGQDPVGQQMGPQERALSSLGQREAIGLHPGPTQAAEKPVVTGDSSRVPEQHGEPFIPEGGRLDRKPQPQTQLTCARSL